MKIYVKTPQDPLHLYNEILILVHLKVISFFWCVAEMVLSYLKIYFTVE